MALPRGGLRRLVRGEPSTPAALEPGLSEIFAALPIAALLVRPDSTVARANSACEHLLNQSERAMREQSLGQLLTLPADHDRPREDHDFAAYDVELILERGRRLRADYMESRLGEHPGWRIVTLHPEGASRRIDRGAGARAAIGAAAMLAHEIKNPLSGIRGAAQLLSGTDSPLDRQELTRLITTEVDRVAALIDRMEDFTDQRPLDLRPGNIYPLIAHAQQVATAGFARGVAMEERFDPSLPPVMLDGDAFLQIVLNLLKNAAEAITEQAHPRIVLTTAYRHGVSVSGGPGRPRQPLPIELCVLDNGPGAPADIAGHLFEPFVSGKREGRGLGLPLVEKLVGAMGGLVQYAREGDPEMTVFRILLPRAAEA